MIIKPQTITKKLLLSLPYRNWDDEKVYDCLYFVPNNKKHESGWMLMCIVGSNYSCDIDGSIDAEIVACCDDIQWRPKIASHHFSTMNTDCTYPSGITRFWSYQCRFKVGIALSSTT
ncbi:MAG TPA: hypothetical protein VNX68_15320, partial [Nitrosopumilaceae archaeon]|nr:hypothetical protein [Nitrosopumilaceae archaeon]